VDILILLGPAGSGKGTQSQFLQETYQFRHLSTGDLLRKEVQSESSLGSKVSSIMKSGDLVSDEIILEIVNDNLKKIATDPSVPGVIFDGFPRTIDQAKQLDNLLTNLNLSLTNILYFDISREDSIKRISGRQIDSRNNHVYHIESNPAPKDCEPFLIQRDDDTPEKVSHRYNIFMEQTKPLLTYYGSQVVEINSLQSINDIQHSIDSILNINSAIR
jgi:adenylate kinase